MSGDNKRWSSKNKKFLQAQEQSAMEAISEPNKSELEEDKGEDGPQPHRGPAS